MKTIQPLRCLTLMLVLFICGTLVFAQDPETEEERKTAMKEQMMARKQMLEQQQEQMKQQQEQMKEVWKQYRGTHSQLTLRKNFNGTTDTSQGYFDVEPDIRHFRCMISGSVKSGEIFIRVQYPGGKVFKDLTINSSADINFSQSVSIREGEESKYAGTWSYVIRADKAEGNYMLQISTN